MAIFPGAVATDTDLYIAVNDLATALSGSLTNVATSIPVVSTTGFPATGFISIDSEIIHYSAIADSTHFTADVRGADGTSAVAHSSSTAVYHNVIAAHHNALKDEIKAIETYIGTTVTTTEFGYIHGVTSAIQTQLNAKAPSASPTFTGVSLFAQGTSSFPGLAGSADTSSGIQLASSSIEVDVGGHKAATFAYVSGTNVRSLLGNSTVYFQVATDVPNAMLVGAPLQLNNTTNQLILGTHDSSGKYITITAPAPAADRVYTISDVGGAGTFAFLEGTQTFSGAKTFSATVDVSGLLKGKGTATNDDAASGYIGEFISATASGVAAATTGQYKDVTSISLTAGDWDVTVSGELTVNSTTATDFIYGFSTTTGNSGTGLTRGLNSLAQSTSATSGFQYTFSLTSRLSLSGSATAYFKLLADYGAGTAPSINNASIHARRVR